MTMDQMEQAAKTGAILEFDFRHLVEAGGAEVIKQLGVEHCLISEFWTYTMPGPPSPEPFKPMEYAGLERVGRFVEEMHAKGFTDRDLDMMVKTNPARLLGLDE
jgi:predicted metal-dependent phosphotriesterase family hydrolase